MENFENQYRIYDQAIVTMALDIVSKGYPGLQELSFNIYETIEDKGEWLSREILSLIEDIEIGLPFTEDFKVFYKNSLLRFDLIQDFLSAKNEKYNVDEELNRVLDYYVSKRKAYRVVRVISCLLFNSVKTEISLQLVDKLLEVYYTTPDFEDRTILFNLGVYSREVFTDNEQVFLYEKYPDFSSY
jgi:hypothetical protein